IETVWADPQTRTAAAAADAAAKLAGIGVPLQELLVQHLGYTPERAREVMAGAVPVNNDPETPAVPAEKEVA
ncbi:hypothetical protein, partial [Rothia kristinae]